jgi:glycosyltransferase 2 family protein
VLNIGLTRLGRAPVDLNLTFRDLVAIFVFYLFSYLLWGAALFCFTNALTPLPLTSFAPFLGVFPAAYALGLIAPFAPAGLGVREGVLTALISFFVPLPIATIIALLTRPWMMVVEIVGAGLALFSYARQGMGNPFKRAGHD